MKTWKRDIFLRVIMQQMDEGGKTAEEALAGYPTLTTEERQELLNKITEERSA
jgi:uncharacterized protein (DUF433 family)